MRHLMYKYDRYSFLSLMLACMLLLISLFKNFKIAIYAALLCLIVSILCDGYVLLCTARKYEALFQITRGVVLLLLLILWIKRS